MFVPPKFGGGMGIAMSVYGDLLEFVGNENEYEVVPNKATSELCSFKIGGKCTAAVYPKNPDAFVALIRRLNDTRLKYEIIGNGTNVVFCDGLYDGIAVCTSKMNKISEKGNTLTAQCGTPLNSLCNKAAQLSLSGLEFAYGIPGSVGGGTFMNAGAYGGEMKDVVTAVTAYDVDNDKIITLDNKECEFAYRDSVFQHKSYVILSTHVTLCAGEVNEIKSKMNELMGQRRTKQPLNYPSAGSTFKRYPGKYTGQMIDQAGLKGKQVGGACVSELHAGFVVNTGNATCKDVKELVEIIKTEIKKREGIEIECEIRFIE